MHSHEIQDKGLDGCKKKRKNIRSMSCNYVIERNVVTCSKITRYPLVPVLTLARTSFFTKRERTWWGGGCHPPCHLSPECDRASRQRPADILGRSESNGVRVDLFRSTVDLPSQVKQKCPVFRDVNFVNFLSITSSLFEIEH